MFDAVVHAAAQVRQGFVTNEPQVRSVHIEVRGACAVRDRNPGSLTSDRMRPPRKEEVVGIQR